jgi:hypothetical protein
MRILPPGRIAVILLSVLPHDQRLADMAGGNDVSESTVRRRRDELIGLLAAQAPRLDRTLKKVATQGGEVVLIDGPLIRTRHRKKLDDYKPYIYRRFTEGCHNARQLFHEVRGQGFPGERTTVNRYVACFGKAW